MSRRSIIKNTEQSLITEAEVITRWSKNRIAIAAFLGILLIGGVVYGIGAFLNNGAKVLGTTDTKINKPEIQVPDATAVQQVIDNAKKSLSEISPQNLVASQPQLQQIITNLESITSSSQSAKSLICDTLCK